MAKRFGVDAMIERREGDPVPGSVHSSSRRMVTVWCPDWPIVAAAVEPGVPDGICVDARGWVWSSSESGVQVFSARGAPLGMIPTPHTCSNCTFSPDGRRLFITGEESLWAVDLA